MRDNDWGISNYPMVPGHEVCSGEFCSEMNLPELFIRLSFNSIAKYYLILTNDGTSSFLLNHWPGSPDASSSDQTAGCRQSRQNRFRRPPAPGRPLPPPSQTRRFLQTSSRAERRERRRRLRSLTRVAQVGDRVGVTWIRDSCNACQGRRRSPHPGTPIQAGRLRWSVSHPGQLQLSHARVSDACPTPTHYPRKTDPPPAVPSSSRAPSRPQARDIRSF